MEQPTNVTFLELDNFLFKEASYYFLLHEQNYPHWGGNVKDIALILNTEDLTVAINRELSLFDYQWLSDEKIAFEVGKDGCLFLDVLFVSDKFDAGVTRLVLVPLKGAAEIYAK